MEEIKKAVSTAVKELFNVDIEPEISRPDEQFGDYSTNVALQLAAKLKQKPSEIAQEIAKNLQSQKEIESAKTAGPGFINIKLTDAFFQQYIHDAMGSDYGANEIYKNQEIVLEHTDPNPFKEFHIGHTYSNTVGISIGKLIENAGGKVHQVTYQGDVGLHIAMAVWAIGERISWDPVRLEELEIEKANSQEYLIKSIKTFSGHYYAEGFKAYNNKSEIASRIRAINKHIYLNDDAVITKIYEWGRQKSLGYFELIYEDLKAHFEDNFFESDTARIGLEVVNKHLTRVFEKSDGAVIYDGEKVGLHKRVFITKEGLPTYETKEIGLAYTKAHKYKKASKFIVITANEIVDYFKVMVAAINEIDPELASKILHISHGLVRLPDGKMSSRKGGVITLTSLKVNIKRQILQLYGEGKDISEVVFGSMKYEFLKHRIGQDIIYDIVGSISVEGNSGPYIQYAYARARSIMNKSKNPKDIRAYNYKLNDSERSLVRKISEYPEVVVKATIELKPHYICTYLYELTQNFNRFYEKNRVIGSEREIDRLTLLSAYIGTLEKGLELLNIPAPERM